MVKTAIPGCAMARSPSLQQATSRKRSFPAPLMNTRALLNIVKLDLYAANCLNFRVKK
jgi:hypothetical protein